MAAAGACRRRLRALLLLGGVALLSALLGTVDAADAAPAENSCPRSLDCAILKREICPHGSSRCGPCIKPYVEDENQQCVKRKKRHSEKVSASPDVDKEIDDLANLLAKQTPDRLQLAVEADPPPVVPNSADSTKNNGAGGQPRAAVQSANEKPAATTSKPSNTPSLMAVKGGPVVSPGLSDDTIILGLVILCSVTGVSALIIAGVCWFNLRKETKLAKKTDYPAHKGTGPTAFDKSMPGDAKLAQSAQMYHYQHQKQQMLSMEKNKEDPKVSDSASASDEENEDGDYTVYECPGLAPTGEMEVKNPLFDDSSLHHALPNVHQ